MRSNLAIFEARVREAERAILANIPKSARRGAFLDIGCGTGNGVVAALANGAKCAVGIDSDLGLFAHDIDFDEFPDLCRKFGADPQRALLIEGDLRTLRFRPGTFDYCLMFDSAEHLPEPQRFIERAFDLLRDGGYFYIDASPLYYSAAGHHLFHLFDAEREPWPHLVPDFEARAMALGASEWHMTVYRTLNKATADELSAACRSAGFSIVSEHRGGETPESAALLERCQDRLDPSLGIDRRWLFESWIQLLAREETRAR